jgi:hypothetical protein
VNGEFVFLQHVAGRWRPYAIGIGVVPVPVTHPIYTSDVSSEIEGRRYCQTAVAPGGHPPKDARSRL